MKKIALTGLVFFSIIFTVFIIFAYASRVQHVYGEYDMDVSGEHDATSPSRKSAPNCWFTALYQPVPAYSPGVYRMERTGERVSAREWYAHLRQLYEYLSQFGEPYWSEICDDLQYLIDTDGYLYIAVFPFYLCADEGKLIALE